MTNELTSAQPDAGHRKEIVEVQQQVRNALFELHNRLTNAPIELPHRNTLRELLSAAYHLTEELGSDESRVEEARQKLAATFEHFGH